MNEVLVSLQSAAF